MHTIINQVSAETQAQPKLMAANLQNKMWERHRMLILRMNMKAD